MRLLVWGLVVLVSLVNIFINISKKYIMTSFGEITLKSFLSFDTWFKLLTNPHAILILSLNFVMWGVTMWAFSLTDASKVIVAFMGMGIPILLINMYLNTKILNEVLTSSQLMGLGFSTFGMIITFIGVWFVTGGVN